ncbi:uracil-DNA glycosylase [Rhizomicrobium electricum]|uniref:Type-4 uracil-DNA glycosylase n=1 Tax=Rhizomicrobium electricum TaxID=480070 RepID=A0ABN1E020_9PROT|nr:uracil-DNA glycosylase [Rhizomicrobium electricum]NIJ47320.1 DNA polymerase [Rhizomicrobium electricum]
MTDPLKNDPLAALAWLVDSGADETIGEEPMNRLVAKPAAPLRAPEAEAPRPMLKPASSFAAPRPAAAAPLPLENNDSIGTAQSLAAAATSLAELKAALEGFDGCALKKSCAHTVFADGNPASRIMFIGEAPGAEEDRQGLPFVGRAGKLLDKMMASIELDRSTAYITNVLNWRPPQNRDPSPEEAAMCLPFLRRHIELVNPGIIILLGAVAARHVLGFSEGIMKLRGRWLEYRVGDVMIPVIATLHPAYLLRQPSHKKLAWRDLQAAEKKIVSLGLLEKTASVR